MQARIFAGVAALAGAAVLLAGLALVLLPKGGTKPLVRSFEVEGGFFANARADETEVPRGALRSPAFELWRSWNPKELGTIGAIASAPFALPGYLAVPHYGFPGEVPGNRVFLRCLGDGRELDVATARTNTQWATEYLRVPSGFCAGPARLAATSATTRFVVGVGTPLTVSATAYHAQTAFPPRALVVVATWALLVSLVATFAWPAARSAAPGFALAAGFCGLGGAAMLAFIAFHVSPPAGRAFSVALAAFGVLGLGAMAAYDRPALGRLVDGHGAGALLWLAIALAYAAFSGAADNGGGSWAINGLFTPARWSTDNQLPFLFAEAMNAGTPRETIRFGHWLASDRTPLLTALYLVLRPAVIAPIARGIGSTFLPTAYMLAATVILSSWVVVLDACSQRFRDRTRHGLVALAVICPLFLFNSLYAWGKLLGGTYILIAALVLLDLRRGEGRNGAGLAAVAVSVALAYLSHGSNAFAAIGLAAVFAGTIWQQGPARIAGATAAALAVAAPWLWWQIVVQPGGDALVRYALTGISNSRIRGVPLVTSMVEAYQRLGWDGWLAAKLNALKIVFALRPFDFTETAQFSPRAGLIGASRVRDFFMPVRSLGIAAVAGLVMLLGFLVRRHVRRPAGFGEIARLGLAGAVGLLVMVVATLIPPITHATAYGSLMLLFVAGASTLLGGARAAAATMTAIAAAYFAVVWLYDPLSIALRLEWSNLAAFIVLAAGLAVFFAAAMMGRGAAGGMITPEPARDGPTAGGRPPA
jgi:hypothetical protein